MAVIIIVSLQLFLWDTSYPSSEVRFRKLRFRDGEHWDLGMCAKRQAPPNTAIFGGAWVYVLRLIAALDSCMAVLLFSRAYDFRRVRSLAQGYLSARALVE